MKTQEVVIAPVPAEIIASAQTIPSLTERVAFGTLKEGLQFTTGLPVFIYVSSTAPHPLHIGGKCSWSGSLLDIVPAVRGGLRDGKHPDPAVRPPFAEMGDTPALWFWEVTGLHRLATAVPFSRFKSATGGNPFPGGVPRWPLIAYLTD